MKKIISNLTNWFIKKYAEEQKKKIDEIYSNELKILFELFKKRTIREVLWDMMFEYDYREPVNRKQRYIIYSKLNSDPEVSLLLKSRYSKNYAAYFNAEGKQQDYLKGRMLEIQDFINCLETAQDRINNWDQYEKVNEKKIILKKDLNNLLLNNNN